MSRASSTCSAKRYQGHMLPYRRISTMTVEEFIVQQPQNASGADDADAVMHLHVGPGNEAWIR